jgi:hypothetical protein
MYELTMFLKAECCGMISSGTLNSEDLLSTINLVLEQIDGYGKIEYDKNDPVDMAEALDEAYNKMNELSPEGYYFGSHPGNGSDIGWFKCED